MKYSLAALVVSAWVPILFTKSKSTFLYFGLWLNPETIFPFIWLACLVASAILYGRRILWLLLLLPIVFYPLGCSIWLAIALKYGRFAP